MSNNLVVFAVYWNEIEWLEASLRQIEAINPKGIVICDGCFDSRKPLNSTDGTLEKLQEFARKRNNVVLLSAQRKTKLNGMLRFLMGYSGYQKQNRFCYARILGLIRLLFLNNYRVNQALTFNYMMAMADFLRLGDWFMSIDADQYYSDSMIARFRKIHDFSDYGLLSGVELTFFDSFEKYTIDYEKRTFSNMPHKLYQDTYCYPTRQFLRERTAGSGEGMLSKFLYINTVAVCEVGEYFHYKFRDVHRLRAAYEVGDRKQPKTELYELKYFKGTHPEIPQDFILMSSRAHANLGRK